MRETVHCKWCSSETLNILKSHCISCHHQTLFISVMQQTHWDLLVKTVCIYAIGLAKFSQTDASTAPMSMSDISVLSLGSGRDVSWF